MHPEFSSKIEGLEKALQALLNSTPSKITEFGKTERLKGIYLFSEAGTHLYIGRTNDIRKRHGLHCNPWSQENQATFAFRLAREETGLTEVGYKPGPTSRKGLLENPVFAQSFQNAKARIANMEFRHFVEEDQITQALLEIYCAVALSTPYNSFKTT